MVPIKQKTIPLARYFLLLVVITCLPLQAQYLLQNYAVTNGKADTALMNSKFRVTVSFGQYLSSDNITNNSKSVTTGIFGFYQLPPKAPIVAATQGDFPDRVEISWSFDKLSPPANLDYFLVYKDNILLTSVPAGQTLFRDFNVQAGTFYSYSVTGVNQYGTSPTGTSVGFVNPNGTITGKIATSNGTPVVDAEVLITPNLGKSLKFNGFSNFVDAGSNLNLNSSDFTIEFWLKQDTPVPGTIFSQNLKSSTSVDSQLAIGFDVSGLFFQINSTRATHAYTPDNQWHHYTWVFNKTTGINLIYIDSAKVKSFTGSAKHGKGAVKFGKGYASDDFLTMYLDEFRVWTIAKDSTSIVRNMSRTINTTSAGLTAYWKMDEGKGTRIFDYATRLNSGAISGPVSFLDDRAPIRNTAFTLSNGYYFAEGINYGTSTNFTILPSLPGRAFVPSERIVTLSTSNTAVNNVDFTDVSQIPVTGFVTHNGTCLNDTTVEILVDDSSWSPRVFTNSEGKYLVEFSPGSSHRLSPRRAGFDFTPMFLQVDSIRAPLANRNFTQTKRYNLIVKVAGGLCEKPLGGTSNVTITPLPACTGVSIPMQQITSGLTTTFSGIPPLIYQVNVTRPSGDIVFTADTVDLRDTSRLKKIIYTAPLQAGVDMKYVPVVCSTVNMYSQLNKYKIRYKAFELYGADTCFVDSSWIFVNNSINDRNIRDSLLAVNGTVIDSFWAGNPNPLDGGPHPYQKSILVSARDLTGRISNTSELWAVVTGVKPRPGQTFVSHSPEIPLMILRKPPGDQSYSYVSQGSTFYNSFSLSVEKGRGTERNYLISLMPSLTLVSGAFVSVETTVLVGGQTYGSFRTYHNNTTTNQLQTTNVVTETITTSNPNIVSEFSGGDVFSGVSYNVVYGLADSVYYNANACSVAVKTSVVMSPDSIKTKFIYSQDYIQNVQIPNLYALQTSRDSLYAHNWERFIAYNDSLKANSNDSLYNISFSAGTQYSYARSFQRDVLFSVYDEMPSDSAFGFILGLFVNNIGVQGGGAFTFSYNIGRTTEIATSTYNETGYTLSDDDNGDGYSVNVARDRVYGTPVFRTLAGQSSCPYEAGTIPRDGAVFQVKHVSASNVYPDSMAVWPIYLGNNSATNESRDYTLRVLNETNPGGLVVAVNGIIVENGIAYTIPYGQIQAILAVKRGPSSNTFESPYAYSNIKLVLSPSCGDDSRSDTLTIDNVTFQKPCSPVALTSPENNWLMTSAQRDTLPVTIGGYTIANTDLTEIWLQYRQVVSASGRPAAEYPRRSELALEGEFIVPKYDLTGYPVFEFPKTKNVKVYYASRTDAYDALKESRYHLIPELQQAAVMNRQPTAFSKQAQFVKTRKNVADDGDSPSNTAQDSKAKQEPTQGGQINGLEGLWSNIKIIKKDSLGAAFTTWNWVNAGLDDGTYEIRALSKCNGVSIDGTTAVLSGVIDKLGPMVQGLPQPNNGILTTAGQIAISFTEPIQRSGITAANNIALAFTSGPSSGQACDFNFSNDGTTIVITPNAPDRFLENQTLRATVKRITDIHGNPMRVPLGTTYIDSTSWEFVVQKSPVRWSGGDITITKDLGETVSITRELVNSSGFAIPYHLRNIPNWMSVSSTQGTVPNQGNIPIVFTFGTNLGYGSYDVTVTDSTIYGDQPLRIHVNVLCHAPNWTANAANYQYSMNIVGELRIDTAWSRDEHDKVGVFVGNETRGSAEVKRMPSGRYRVFLTVYSNQEAGEQLQMRVWDSSACNEYGQIIESFTFAANTVQGSIDNPRTITATTQMIQQYKMNAGWTWVSFNTRSADMSVSNILYNLNPAAGDLIKEQGPYAQYVSDHLWIGSLDTIRNTKMYLLKLTSKDSLNRVGYPLLPDQNPIIVNPGWNYVGYIPQNDLPVNEALAALQAAQGDLIKNQTSFAIYDSTDGWFGDLIYMKQKLGYLLKVSRKDTLIYPLPSAARFTSLAEELYLKQIEGHPEWVVPANEYQYTMSVVAKLGQGILDSVDQTTVLGVFSKNVCRGFCSPVRSAGGEYLFFLTVYGNTAEGDSLQFRIYDRKSDRVFGMLSGMRFQADAVRGSVRAPIALTGAPLEVRDGTLIPHEFSMAQNYPNPFNPSTSIDYALPVNCDVVIEIYSVMGEKVKTLTAGYQPAGFHTAVWNGKNEYSAVMPSGVYLYTMRAGNFSSTKKLTLLK